MTAQPQTPVARLKAWGRHLLPDRYERALVYYRTYGRIPRVQGAELWSEKVNVRVLYDRRPIIATMVDKLAAREHVARVAPGLRLPRLYWSGTDVAELADLDLEANWVLKPNHRSGDVYLGRGPVRDVAALREATAGWLEEFQFRREWAYARARRLLMVEEHLGNPDQTPDDYKFFAFDGKVKCVEVHRSRFSGHVARFYSPDWEPLQAKSGVAQATLQPAPAGLEEMLAMAEALSEGIDFVRVDLYNVGGTVYFGELTPYPSSGHYRFDPPSFDAELCLAWSLPPEVLAAASAPPLVEACRRLLEQSLVKWRGPGDV